MEVFLRPFSGRRGQLKNYARAVGSAGIGFTIQVAESVDCEGRNAIVVTSLRDVEIVDNAFLPGPPAARSQLVCRTKTELASSERGAIGVPRTVKHQCGFGQ